jgi:hypothetical protein
MFLPALSAWTATLDTGYITTFPNVTSAQVCSHPPQSIPMIKGHLDQARSNAQSTKPKVVYILPKTQASPASTTPDDSSLPADPSSLRTHHIYASYQPITGQIFSDPTGRFILPSSMGNKGMLLLYNHDSNYIHVEPLKYHQSFKMLAAYKQGHSLFTQRGLKPQLQNYIRKPLPCSSSS